VYILLVILANLAVIISIVIICPPGIVVIVIVGPPGIVVIGPPRTIVMAEAEC
jgi:hypothetical protein